MQAEKNQVQQQLKKPYNPPKFTVHGDTKQILESIETTGPAKRCVQKDPGPGDGFGSIPPEA
jgi:hypothetical protein